MTRRLHQLFLPLPGLFDLPDPRSPTGTSRAHRGEARHPAGTAAPRRAVHPSTLGSPPGPRPPRGMDLSLTARCRALCGKLRLTKLADRVRVVWNPRLQTTAGLARFSQSVIELNPRLRGFGSAEVDRTLRHELAHLVAHARAGRASGRIAAHGPEWRRACCDLGIPDESRCHSLPLPSRTVARKFAYQCPKCRAIVLRVRKFYRYSACYSCCQTYADGRYDRRFQLQQIPMETAERSSRDSSIPNRNPARRISR